MPITKTFSLLCVFAGCILCSCSEDDDVPAEPIDPVEPTIADSPVTSTFFATAFVEQDALYDTPSDGDLWPVAWSDDNFLYAANGDGKGFDLNSEWSDVVMNRISGHPDERNISGQRLASGSQLGQVWGI